MLLELAGAGDIGEPEAHAGELAGEELGVGLGALGDTAVVVGLDRSRCSWRFWASRISGAA